MNLLLDANTTFQRLFDFEHTIIYIFVALLIATFVLLFYNFVYHFREQDTKIKEISETSRLSLVLNTGNLKLWLYDTQHRNYRLLRDDGIFSAPYNPIEFSKFFDRDDFEILRKAIFDICEGRRLSAKATVRSAVQENGETLVYDYHLSVASRDAHGEISSLLCIQHDVTDEHQRRAAVNQLLVRYHTVFNSSLMDMVYYDKDGILRDINEKACQQFGVPDRQTVLDGNFLLVNNPFYSGITFDKMENTRTTSIVDFADYSDEVYRTKEFGLHGKMYYESTINPIRNADGELEGIYMCGRNITEMVESVHYQQESTKKLRRIIKDIKTYIENVNYALRVTDVRLVNYNPSTYTMEVSTNVNEAQLRLSQLRCIRLGTPRFRRNISSALNRMDHLTPNPIELKIETEIRDERRHPIWLQFNLVPMRDEEGNVVRYFGMCRNMTRMVETEQQLAIETKKAQETELLKQAFLTNMSYEIRTPLNTVIGFAELFEQEHDAAYEALFVDQIRQNSNSLLHLVNDILYLSRLDANMEEYKTEPTDFALLFESYCQLGWSGVKSGVKTSIDNPYEHLVVDIDAEHLSKVIEKLCVNSVYFTTEGYIRAKCEYRHGELTIAIEDTGQGIDEATLPHVFDRFVRDSNEEMCGTGLDLPIVQSLVEQMGGTIEMQSEVGKGTTAWVSIPCTATTIEKRIETEI